MKRTLTFLLALALIPALASAGQHFQGDLGQLNMGKAMEASAHGAMQNIAMDRFNALGNEELVISDIVRDELGAVHVRFEQKINGLDVIGGDLFLHAHADGKIFGVNGDFARGDVSISPKLGADAALEFAMNKASIRGQRVADVDMAYVIVDGAARLAWRTTVEYANAQGPQRDVLLADAITGDIAARLPQIHYARNLNTQDCNQKTKNCGTVSSSSNAINTGDLAVDSAHNYAIATYDYYFANYNRDSIDGNGMTLISRVHYDRNYNNAFWDGSQMTYGDGDGSTFVPLSQDADVVAHELTHGVTERSSGLIYQNESGALNEALSDIFGALVDRETGATGNDIWLIGEDIYTPGTPGDALRDMACPSCVGDYDYYPTRYTGTSDNGGVHWNSGIANKAFYLLVTGGSFQGVSVPSIGFDAAADAFYAANTSCLTSGSNFAAARYCTADVHGGSNAAAIHLAWDAVGVPNDPPAPPAPPIALTDGVALGGQDGAAGVTQAYTLGVASGDSVTCSTSCNNGDADLYLRFDGTPETNPNSTVNACGSYSSTSNESCTTGSASSAGTLNAAVQAYSAYTNLSITCTIGSGGPGGCSPAGASCSAGSECCSGSCKGKPGSKSCN